MSPAMADVAPVAGVYIPLTANGISYTLIYLRDTEASAGACIGVLVGTVSL